MKRPRLTPAALALELGRRRSAIGWGIEEIGEIVAQWGVDAEAYSRIEAGEAVTALEKRLCLEALELAEEHEAVHESSPSVHQNGPAVHETEPSASLIPESNAVAVLGRAVADESEPERTDGRCRHDINAKWCAICQGGGGRR